MNILETLRDRFQDPLLPLCPDAAAYLPLLKPAQDPRFGDYQANFMMPLAKALGANPRELASQVIGRASLDDLCTAPEVAGPGFINLRLRDDWLERQINRLVGDDRLGVEPVAVPRRIVIDYSAPNVAKPMHVGHLRSAVIGDALYRLLKFLGHHVTGDNHIGDWGTQFGMVIYGYKHFLDPQAYQQDAVVELARLYRLVNQLAEYHEAVAALPAARGQLEAARARQTELSGAPAPADKSAAEAHRRQLKQLAGEVNQGEEQVQALERKVAAVERNPILLAQAQAHPEIARAARQETALLHAGDQQNLALWRQFMPACLAAINALYERLGIRFDLTLGESFYQPYLADVVADLVSKGIAVESAGAICVFIPEVEAPFIIRKSDGAYTYATTDLATIRYRAQTLRAQAMYYVVDARQSDHFRLLFETARRAGYDQIEFRHVSFGTILGEDKRPFKTRSGDTVGLESLLDEAVDRARRIVDAADDAKPDGPELDAATRQRIACAVGIGAIKYADLSQNRDTDYVFSFDKMLALRGDTATYMQYAYARVCGIFRKGQVNREQLRRGGQPILLTTPAERALALALLRYAEALDQAAAECRPNLITGYLFSTADRFSTFFEECPVLKAESDALRASRLLLADLTARVISHGLQLLGIETIERM